MTPPGTVLVTGGAGYVGAALVPKLLARGHRVRVLDLFLFGEDVLARWRGPNLEEIKGDLRDRDIVARAVEGVHTIIHLACVSNDPSFELDPEFGRSVNYDAFLLLVDLARRARIRRFIYASTSSVYGVKVERDVSEDLPREPLTDYSRFKAMCEDVLVALDPSPFGWVIIRPATVCGYSPRLRLDLTVNIMTNHAVTTGCITVLGGGQKRPNIHIDDITDLYVDLVALPDDRVHRRIYNAGYENRTVQEIAELTRAVVVESGLRQEVEITTAPTNDPRSYHISSDKIGRELGFVPRKTIHDAVRDLCGAFASGSIPDSMTDIRYYNIRTMQARLNELKPAALPQGRP